MNIENIETYLELINGIIGIGIFIVTLSVFRFTTKNPELIKSYFFLQSGEISKSFFFLMIGMLIWGIRELYKVLELEQIIHIELFYETAELFSAISLLLGMMYFYKITKAGNK